MHDLRKMYSEIGRFCGFRVFYGHFNLLSCLNTILLILNVHVLFIESGSMCVLELHVFAMYLNTSDCISRCALQYFVVYKHN